MMKWGGLQHARGYKKCLQSFSRKIRSEEISVGTKTYVGGKGKGKVVPVIF